MFLAETLYLFTLFVLLHIVLLLCSKTIPLKANEDFDDERIEKAAFGELKPSK